MAASSDSSKPYIPLASLARDGWSTDEEATATCFCGAVQLAFTFVCNCTDCRKITASMFVSNFTVRDSHLRHIRGQENLKVFKQSETILKKRSMANYFCSTCGTLMYRVGEAWPGQSILRIGTVDDFSLHETKLKPQLEQFTKDRVSWVHGVDGAEKAESMP
ncbi:unnamed protein product [Clonostachys chloroleuca]|uniref:CENP-V/GFA domain-containing protein n=1 Tax=Clonostachys chloroleuca TaxID=1926264 RepID=A0AA35QBR0_9HYPO|nr:unnamed protein product [Clonostachys chloroleuca]